MAVSGSTVLWLDRQGANSEVDTLWVASPEAGRKRLASWFPDKDSASLLGTFFGGVDARGKALVYAFYELAPVSRKPNACADTPCRRHVTGGGTFLVTPGSLAVRRILPPARAVAVGGNKVVAAVLARGGAYTGKAQIVVWNLLDGSRRMVGTPAPVQAVAVDGSRVAALVGPEDVAPTALRLWNLRAGSPVRTFRVPAVDRSLALAGAHAVLRIGGTILTLNLRSGRRHVVARYRPNEDERYGPWISGRRVLWVEAYNLGETAPRLLLRSAPLPPASS